MFYCESCRQKNKWPVTAARSHGECEECGNDAECYDYPLSMLLAGDPDAEDESDSDCL